MMNRKGEVLFYLMALESSPEKLWSAMICTELALQFAVSDSSSSSEYVSELSACSHKTKIINQIKINPIDFVDLHCTLPFVCHNWSS